MPNHLQPITPAAAAQASLWDHAWAQALPALLLVFYPMNALLPVGVRLRTLDELVERSRGEGRGWFAWCVPVWLLDPVRAFAGAWLLKRVMINAGDGGLWGGESRQWTVAFVFTLAAGLVAQLWTQREPHVAWAPVGFCAGLLLALAPLLPACAVILTGVLGLVLLRSWTGYFLGLVAAALAIGLLPVGGAPWFTLAGLMAIPAALPVLIGCRLVAPSAT